MTKDAILLYFETNLLVSLSLFYKQNSYFSNAYRSLFRLPPPPTTTKISTTFSTPRSGGVIKGTDSSKFKVTVKSDTDIPALVFFCSFSFYLIFYLLFSFLRLFCPFLFLFINLRACNSINILTRAQHSQASR